MSAPTRHRWMQRINMPDGSVGTIVLQVRDGVIYGQLGEVGGKMEPSELAHFRTILGEALAAALWDRGDW